MHLCRSLQNLPKLLVVVARFDHSPFILASLRSLVSCRPTVRSLSLCLHWHQFLHLQETYVRFLNRRLWFIGRNRDGGVRMVFVDRLEITQRCNITVEQ